MYLSLLSNFSQMKKINFPLILIAWTLFPVCLRRQIYVPDGNVDSPDTSRFFISFDSTRIHFETWGRGEPVLLLHGFVVSGASWKNTALYKDLIRSGFTVIVPDLRGNGLSGKPHNPEAYAQDAEAKDMMGLIKMLGFNHYSVVGYSRGSIIAARLLVLDKRVVKGVLGGMGADFTNPEWPRRIMFYKALMGEPVKELEGMVKYIQSSGLDQLALAYLQKEQPSTSKKELGALKQPVLVVCGDKDSDNGSSDELVKLIPNARHANVPGDHGGAVRTAEFSSAVISFLEKR
jgi:pimeloyl-ACP methyl ester carboxylesterase